MDLDGIFQETGGFGRLQLIVVAIFLPLTMSLGSFSYWSQILILLVPNHHCRLPSDLGEEFTNTTQAGQCSMLQNHGVSVDESGGLVNLEPWASYSSWNTFLSVFNADPVSTTSAGIGCELGWEYDINLMYHTVPSENNWVCEDSWKVYFSHTIYWIGSTVGYFFSGFFLDRFGRWKVAFALVLVQTISTVCTIFSSGVFPLFCAFRFLCGLAAMPMQSTSYTLAVEVIMSNKRRVVGVVTAIYWLLTAAACPGMALLLRDWRWILAVAACPGPILIVLMKFIPESPSWLLSQGETEAAFKVFGYISKMNGYSENSSLKKMKENLVNSMGHVKKQSVLKTTLSILKFPNIRKRTLLLFFAWFSVCLSYHGNNLSQSSAGDNVFLLYTLGSLLEIPVCFVYLFTVDRLGRKPPILTSLAFVAVLTPLVNLIHPDSIWIRFGMNIFVRGLFSLAYNVLFQLGCELFPTSLRGRGVFLMRTFGDVGTSIAPFILNANASWQFLSSAVFSALSLLCCALTIQLPETRGQALPQNISEAEEFGHDTQGFLSTFPCFRRMAPKSTRLSKADLLSSARGLSICSETGVNPSLDFSGVSVRL